jgi:hypothetical protein
MLTELCLERNLSVINGKEILRAKLLTEYGQNTKKDREINVCIKKR